MDMEHLDEEINLDEADIVCEKCGWYYNTVE